MQFKYIQFFVLMLLASLNRYLICGILTCPPLKFIKCASVNAKKPGICERQRWRRLVMPGPSHVLFTIHQTTKGDDIEQTNPEKWHSLLPSLFVPLFLKHPCRCRTEKFKTAWKPLTHIRDICFFFFHLTPTSSSPLF